VWARANDDVRVVLEARGATPTEARWGKIGEAHVWVAPHDEPLDEVRIERLCDERHGDIELLSWEWSAPDSAAIKQRVRHNGVALTLRTIPMDLVRGTHAVTFSERPEVDVELIGGAAGARVRLTHARCGEPPSHWSDLIDSWMVAWRPHDASRPSWHGFRAAGGSLALETPPIAGASEVDVTVLTVFGDEFAKTLVVEC
jgi:hypothetical protein